MKKFIPYLLLLLFTTLAVTAFVKGDVTNIYTTATAVVSLGFSLFGFYFQYLHNIHKISCTPVEISFTGKSIDAYCTFENLGNNEEIIIGGTFIFPKKDKNGYSSITRKANLNSMLPEIMEPFILKPKQIELKHFSWPVSYDDLLIHFYLTKGQEFEQEVDLKVDFINPHNRSKSAKLVELGTVKFYKDFASFNKLNYSQVQLFEGKLMKI